MEHAVLIRVMAHRLALYDLQIRILTQTLEEEGLFSHQEFLALFRAAWRNEGAGLERRIEQALSSGFDDEWQREMGIEPES